MVDAVLCRVLCRSRRACAKADARLILELGLERRAGAPMAAPRDLTRVSVSLWEQGLTDSDIRALFSDTEITAKTLNLGKNNLSPEGAQVVAKALAVNRTVTHLDLSYNRIGDVGAVALAEALDAGSCWTHLYLHGVDMTQGGAEALADSLRKNKSLTVLGLGDNAIEDRGAAALASALKSNDTLRELYLPRNGCTDTGVLELAEALKTNTTVHTLLFHEYVRVKEALLREVRATLAGREEAARRACAMLELS